MEQEKNVKNAHQFVIETIQAMIINGELKEGDKLPPERTLTEQLNVGRPSLREALKALEVLGLIESRHGKGNYVVDHVQSSYFKPLSISFMLSNGSSEEILEMRYCLESFAVQKACEKATPLDIMSLQRMLDQMVSAPTTSEKAALDRAIHFEIARISGNMLIYNTMKNISFLMDSFIEHSVQLSSFEGDSIENIYNEHTQIINAIEHRDETAAVNALKQHLGNINIDLI